MKKFLKEFGKSITEKAIAEPVGAIFLFVSVSCFSSAFILLIVFAITKGY